MGLFNVNIVELPWSCRGCDTRSKWQRSAARHRQEQKDAAQYTDELPWGADYNRVKTEHIAHPGEGNLTFTPIGHYVPRYLRKYVSDDCLNTVLVKDTAVDDQVHELFRDLGITTVVGPQWKEAIDVKLNDLGEEFKANVPVPVFNVLIDVFDLSCHIVDSDQRQRTA